MKCPICHGTLQSGKFPYAYHDIPLGTYEGSKCPACGEIFFSEKASAEIDRKAKEIGIWGMGREGVLGTSGNSLIVRVPKEISDFLGFLPGKKVFIHPEGKKKLVVETE